MLFFFNKKVLTVAHEKKDGFVVFTLQPFCQALFVKCPLARLSHIATYDKSNIFALVSANQPTTVHLWDAHRNVCLAQLAQEDAVSNVRFSGSFVLIATLRKVRVLSLHNISETLHALSCRENSRGLCVAEAESCALTGKKQIPSPPSWTCIACPNDVRGGLWISWRNQAFKSLQAHQTDLAALELCSEGSMLATASTRGTVVRLWSTSSCELLRTLRTGVTACDIRGITFHPCNAFVMCWLTDASEGHIWSLITPQDGTTTGVAGFARWIVKQAQRTLTCEFSERFALASSCCLEEKQSEVVHFPFFSSPTTLSCFCGSPLRLCLSVCCSLNTATGDIERSEIADTMQTL